MQASGAAELGEFVNFKALEFKEKQEEEDLEDTDQADPNPEGGRGMSGPGVRAKKGPVPRMPKGCASAVAGKAMHEELTPSKTPSAKPVARPLPNPP